MKRCWLIFMVASLGGVAMWMGCGGGGSGSTTTSTCASGSNDFYVVENASCAVNAGKLTRVNPDVPCKEEIVTGLDCPVDVVINSAKTIAYMTLRTNNSVGSDGAQPGQIYQVNLSTHVATSMNSGAFFRSFVSPAGITMLEMTAAESQTICSNSLQDVLLLIADEGSSSGGTVWLWCVNSSDVSESATLQALFSVSADQMENPRGVAIVNRDTVYVTAHSANDAAGILLSKGVTSTSQATVEITGFTTEVKDVTVDSNGTNLLVADAGDGQIWRFVPGTGAMAVQSGLGGPRDVLVNSSSSFYITEFTDNDIVSSALQSGTASALSGISLSGPDGLDR